MDIPKIDELSCSYWANASYSPPRPQIQVNYGDGWFLQLKKESNLWRVTDGARLWQFPWKMRRLIKQLIRELNAG